MNKPNYRSIAIMLCGFLFLFSSCGTKNEPEIVQSILFNPNLTYNTVTDIDGNIYKTIVIGTQTWMAENLKVTKYRNGVAIPNVTSNTAWSKLTTGAWCTYGNTLTADSIVKFGRLYNGFAIYDSRNIAPTGWHVATDAEWKTLVTYVSTHLGTSTSIGQALAGTNSWGVGEVLGSDRINYNLSSNNSTGFTAIAAGGRTADGTFHAIDGNAYWMTSTNGIEWWTSYSRKDISESTGGAIDATGYSVRCVKD